MNIKLTPSSFPVTKNSAGPTRSAPQDSDLDLGKLDTILLLRNAPSNCLGVSGAFGMAMLDRPLNDVKGMAEMLSSPKLSPFRQPGPVPAKVQAKAIQHLAAGLEQVSYGGSGLGPSLAHYATASLAVRVANRTLADSQVEGAQGATASGEIGWQISK